jgi:flavodoxin I
MKKVLVAYSSRTKKTKAMANYIAEGLRMSACQVDVKPISAIESEEDLAGYECYVFGCPTYHKDMTGGMKQFLFKAELARLAGKFGGAFGSHTHSGESAPMIYDTMLHVFKMDMTDLGPLNLTEAKVLTDEGMNACQAYGKALAEKFT